MTYRIAVVAHQARADQAHNLQDTVGAAYLSMSNGNWNCEQNHRRCWEYHEHRTTEEWSVVLEDDALPVEGFTTQLAQALAASPCDVVSLYLGQGQPIHWQERAGQAIATAEREHACWIQGKRLLHGVAVCIKTDLISSMLDHTLTSKRPIDLAIKDWAVAAGHDICFPVPSLVEHADGPTLITGRTDTQRDMTRTAWRVGTRDRWTSKAVPL